MLTGDIKKTGERKEMLLEEEKTATNLITLWDFDGVLKYSPLFYGYYSTTPEKEDNKPRKGYGYRIPLAYFLTGLGVYIYSFVATLRR